MRGTISDILFERGILRIAGDDGVTYAAGKQALIGLTFDPALAGRVTFTARDGWARDVRRWPRTRQATAAPENVGIIRHVSARGDFAWVEVPGRGNRNVFVHRAHFHAGRNFAVGDIVTYRVGKDKAGRPMLTDVFLQDTTCKVES